MVKVKCNGMMVNHMKVILKKDNFMKKVYLVGRIINDLKGIIKMVLEKVKVNYTYKMEI